MNRIVVFNELWILSERDGSARHLAFHPQRNLLAGSNGTGKSRVLKHLVWALGCEPPKRAAGEFDSNVVAMVGVSIGATKRVFLRQNRSRAAFDAEGKLLFATDVAGKWNEFFAQEFDFPLKLQRHEDEGFALAGPSYAFLPFYIDQDGGWGIKWTTFTDLAQFTNWQTPVFNSFSGLKPAAYVRDQLLRDESAYRLRMAKAQAKVQQASFQRVVAMLPPESTVIDESLFAQQLRDIAVQAQALQAEQDEVRVDLLALAQERQQKADELQTTLKSEKALVEDLAFLASYKDSEQLVCPTCSHVHVTSFSARQVLAVDAHEIHEVTVKLQSQLEKLKVKELTLQQKLSAVATRLRSIKTAFNEERGGQRVADVVAAKSRDTLKQAYDFTRNELATQIESLVDEKRELDEKLVALSDKGREKRIREYFGESLVSFADKLDIDKAEIGTKLKIGARPPSASGSYAPRAVLATHLALVGAHEQFGVGCALPFIVDTPQQSGQDPVSLGRMLDAILIDSGTGQRMVATESIPDGWQAPDGTNVLQFDKKRSLLRVEEYRQGVVALSALVAAMKEVVLAARTVAEPELGPAPTDFHDDEEDDDV